MFSGKKNIFSHKGNLINEPFMPCISDENGMNHLYKKTNSHYCGAKNNGRPGIRIFKNSRYSF